MAVDDGGKEKIESKKKKKEEKKRTDGTSLSTSTRSDASINRDVHLSMSVSGEMSHLWPGDMGGAV